MYKRLHPDDIQLVATFREEMDEHLEVVKDQVIADLEKFQPVSLEQEHDLQYNLVHKRPSELVERASEDIKKMCSLILHSWEEAVLEESKTGEAFAIYGLPRKTVSQLVPENRIHEGHNPRLWTGEGSEQVEGSLYDIDVDQNPFEIALDDDFNPHSFLSIWHFGKHSKSLTRGFLGGWKKENDQIIQNVGAFQGIVSATHALIRERK